MAGNGLAVIVLRFTHKTAPRPFRTPLYPLLPILYAASSLAMTYSSLAYVRAGAFFGVGVLAVGVAFALVFNKQEPAP